MALMAAQRSPVAALVVLEPSLPLELSGGDPLRGVRSGTYDAESAYGPLPPGTRSRLESLRALDERKRGISVPSVDCPVLVVAGRTGQPGARSVAGHFDADLLEFPDLGHSDLVGDPRVLARIASWLTGAGAPRRERQRSAIGRPTVSGSRSSGSIAR